MIAAEPDWRNDAVFLFDLAMLAGGHARAVAHALVPVPLDLCESLGMALAGLVHEPRLQPSRRLRHEAVLPPGVWRSAVLAQALRVGVLLQAHDVPGASSRARLDAPAQALAARVDARGEIPFRTDTPPLANV